MMHVKMVHHINVQITDRQRTREWYEQVLGARFLDRGPALNQRQLQLNSNVPAGQPPGVQTVLKWLWFAPRTSCMYFALASDGEV